MIYFVLALAEMFTELKKNGLSQPPEFDENEEDGDGGGRSDKFETSDVAGLGEGEGAKDVSDQIENEDQLDDAKTKEEREKEKNEEKDDEEKTKEEENGIEMSDDFDAKMEDVEREEKDENNEEEDDEEDDEVDDQKGSVEDPMNALDKNLWNGSYFEKINHHLLKNFY
jgi:midasin